MRADDYGPVAVSRLKTEREAIFAALNAGRRVLIARRGKVLYAIDPAPDLPAAVHAMYAMPQFDTTPFEVSATILNQGIPSPAQWLRKVDAGEPALLTRSGKLYGAVRPYTLEAADDTDDRLDERIDAFLAEHPDATPGDLADFTARAESEADAPAPARPYLDELVGRTLNGGNERRKAGQAALRSAFELDAVTVDTPLRHIVKHATW